MSKNWWDECECIYNSLITCRFENCSKCENNPHSPMSNKLDNFKIIQGEQLTIDGLSKEKT